MQILQACILLSNCINCTCQYKSEDKTQISLFFLFKDRVRALPKSGHVAVWRTAFILCPCPFLHCAARGGNDLQSRKKYLLCVLSELGGLWEWWGLTEPELQDAERRDAGESGFPIGSEYTKLGLARVGSKARLAGSKENTGYSFPCGVPDNSGASFCVCCVVGGCVGLPRAPVLRGEACRSHNTDSGLISQRVQPADRIKSNRRRRLVHWVAFVSTTSAVFVARKSVQVNRPEGRASGCGCTCLQGGKRKTSISPWLADVDNALRSEDGESYEHEYGSLAFELEA